MQIEEAIQTAIEYETELRDIYFEAAEAEDDDKGRQFFQSMGKDEQGHLDYLEDRLKQWQKTGKLSAEKLKSTLPSATEIERLASEVKSLVGKASRGLKSQMLSKALKMEIKTSEFYQKMVDEMPAEAQQMFARFLEMEINHIRTLEFELDYISKTGYWFDVKEFDME
ncbi:MAG: ferritin family protein [Desulfobacterales bacterium]|nr:ferritin family protein [Desulfobacterales bacterium]